MVVLLYPPILIIFTHIIHLYIHAYTYLLAYINIFLPFDVGVGSKRTLGKSYTWPLL